MQITHFYSGLLLVAQVIHDEQIASADDLMLWSKAIRAEDEHWYYRLVTALTII